ncbi:MAG TPA: hypothetical protein VHE61_04930 [Opitutaceae bacterium]|nr:hypothetical protein [Opitutaceae bacterium]
MLSLAAFKYRNVLAEYGGPVARIQMGEFPLRGRKVTLANVTLKPGLVLKGPMTMFNGAADGTGVDPVPSVARHMAVSEALERWAFSTLVRSERAKDFGFDIDPTSTGMSAFPGLFGRQARRRSVLEAVERFSIISWWDGKIAARTFDTDWPGVSAVAIDGPFGGVTVIVYARTQWGGYAYGHAADESFTGACERAIVELARNEWVLRSWWLSFIAGDRQLPSNIIERRCLFFASDEGHALFQEKVRQRPGEKGPAAEVICDAELPGPWDDYATVWRFALRPPTREYLRNEKFFFL